MWLFPSLLWPSCIIGMLFFSMLFITECPMGFLDKFILVWSGSHCKDTDIFPKEFLLLYYHRGIWILLGMSMWDFTYICYSQNSSETNHSITFITTCFQEKKIVLHDTYLSFRQLFGLVSVLFNNCNLWTNLLLFVFIAFFSSIATDYSLIPWSQNTIVSPSNGGAHL